MRIVGGKHRGRRLEAPTDSAVRPTSDRTREALFNILAHAEWSSGLDELTVLDAFCGTGALALEALSRGAGQAFFIDSAPASLALAKRNAELLGEAARCRFLRGDATHPPVPPQPAHLVFLDPPYGKALAEPALMALSVTGWLAPGAICVVERASGAAFEAPVGFALLDERRYGATTVYFLRRG
jgi:16S rRNA (guanine966-N2)-methyltransferase